MFNGAVKSESGMHPIDPPSGAVVVSTESALAKAAKLAPPRILVRNDRAVASEPTSITETQAKDILFLLAAA